MKREIINLENTWDNQKFKQKKKRKYQKKLKQKDLIKEKLMPKRKRGRPKIYKNNQDSVIQNEDNNDIIKYKLNDKYYYNFMDLLMFIKNCYGIDYENSILKDEQKQEFKVKLNSFFSNYSR